MEYGMQLSLNKCAWNDATGHLTRLRHITILPVYKLVKVSQLQTSFLLAVTYFLL
ncbi:hypothetical protein HanPSC8_Chr17g0775551 [Helianthus annuus]|nr:hypothetical protein HanPSC8_Chr17g0775551 [Helianthus annuus]